MQKIDSFSRKAALSKLELMPTDGNLVSHPFKKLSIICICTESIKYLAMSILKKYISATFKISKIWRRVSSGINK